MRKSKFLAMLLTLVMLAAMVPTAALADSSTTVVDGDLAKDLTPNTEIYIVTDTPGSDYKYFGQKLEPNGGVYYGRVGEGGNRILPNGNYGYGMVNDDKLVGESIVSFYHSLDATYNLDYWKYMYERYVASDMKHVLLINLNFDHLYDDMTYVIEGRYDSRLIEDFQFLNTREYPIMLRIGGEMTEWTYFENGEYKRDPERYKKAYRHIADLARQYAPDVALVFSPLYGGATGVDKDWFYPGDDYVDWVGCSLYYNKFAATDETRYDSHIGINEFGDALLNVQQTVNLSKLHNKPVIITEGGSAYKIKHNGTTGEWEDVTTFAKDRLARAMSFLPMVYPEIKAMVYSDTNFYASAPTQYKIYDNQEMTAVYDKAVANNPVLLHDCNDKDNSVFYTRFGSRPSSALTGKVQLAAYTMEYYSKLPLTATWTLDGKTINTTKEYPYSCELDMSTIVPGQHTIKVAFSNGQTKSYTFTGGEYEAPRHSITVTPAENGRITASADAAEGSTVTLTAAPNNGYKVKSITVNDAGGNKVQVTSTGTNTYTFVMPKSNVTVTSEFRKTPANEFNDVKDATAYYYDSVYWAVAKGVTSGTGDNNFTPNRTCTRQEVVTFLWRAMGQPEPETTVNPFTDVPENSYYYKAVLWASEHGITSGSGDGKFSPGRTCSRKEVVTFLWRTMNKPAGTGSNPFTDITKDYSYDAILWANANSITTGTSATTFNPNGTCSRGQVATFLYRTFEDMD